METIQVPQKVQTGMKVMMAVMITLAVIIVLCGVFAIIAWTYDVAWFNEDFKDLTWYNRECREGTVCCMPGCNGKAVSSVSYNIDTNSKIATALNIENSAGFYIEKGSYMAQKKDKAVHKEKYNTITYVGDGKFVLGEEELRYEYYVDGETYERFYTRFGGEYCDLHKGQAVTILKDEIKTAANKNVIYFLGNTSSPYQFLICFFLLGLTFQLGYSIPVARLRMGIMDEDKLKYTISYTIKDRLAPSLFVILVVLAAVYLSTEFGLISGFDDKLMISLLGFAAIFPAWSIGCIVTIIIGKRKLKMLQN